MLVSLQSLGVSNLSDTVARLAFDRVDSAPRSYGLLFYCSGACPLQAGNKAVYAECRSGTSSRIGGEEAGRQFRLAARAVDLPLRVIPGMRVGDICKGKSKLATLARKQSSSLYLYFRSLSV